MYTNDSWLNYTKFIVDFDIEKALFTSKGLYLYNP